MLQHLYDVEPTRRFLLDAGARRLDAGDPAIPAEIEKKRGERWLLPTEWRHAAEIVIFFGDTYPDDPPRLFLPASSSERPLIPHISVSGDICTVDRSFVVNPSKPVEVLKTCIEVARSILDRDWTDAELTNEINPELLPYWDLAATKNLLFSGDSLSKPLLLAKPFLGRKDTFELEEAPDDKLRSPATLALVAELGQNETVAFLRSPNTFLRSSSGFRKRLEDFAETVSPCTKALKSFDLVIVLRVMMEEECVLAGVVRQSISSKGKNAKQLYNAVFGVLAHKQIMPWRAEDTCTKRLLKRTTGPFYKEARLHQRVALIGCGSLGGFVGEGLAQSGIRNFFFCDTDFLTAGNLLRHTLSKRYLYLNKADSMSRHIRDRLPDAEITVCAEDIRTPTASASLMAFDPDIVLLMTGDTNTEITMSRVLHLTGRPPVVFGWADTDLRAGHLVYQPAGTAPVLQSLYSDKTGRYVHSLTEDAVTLLKEGGCQNSYSPYSGLSMSRFANLVAQRVVEWMDAPPQGHIVLRTKEVDPWEQIR